jgi:phosphoglycolate phosphatase-like HAD superfamily hydrolase
MLNRATIVFDLDGTLVDTAHARGGGRAAALLIRPNPAADWAYFHPAVLNEEP